MPDQPIDKARKLQKLGERIRDGFAKEHPAPDKSLETVQQTIRKEWEKDRAAKPQNPTASAPAKDRGRKPDEPEPNH